MTGLRDRIARVLCVEDDAGTRILLRHALGQAAYDVTALGSAEEAIDWIRRHGLPDVLVSDIGLPGANGIELCRVVQGFSDVPCILISVIDDEESVARAIEEVAEDYLVKPIRPAELRARVGRALRRVGIAGAVGIAWQRLDDQLSVSFASQQLRRGEALQELTPTEAKILHLLWRRSPESLSMELLRQRLQPGAEISEEAVRVHLHRLRRKIEVDPGTPRRLLTDPGRGYRLAVESAASGGGR
jgi:DNA-binding response OmpR family regulator